jgi:hypothetical protein
MVHMCLIGSRIVVGQSVSVQLEVRRHRVLTSSIAESSYVSRVLMPLRFASSTAPSWLVVLCTINIGNFDRNRCRCASVIFQHDAGILWLLWKHSCCGNIGQCIVPCARCSLRWYVTTCLIDGARTRSEPLRGSEPNRACWAWNELCNTYST